MSEFIKKREFNKFVDFLRQNHEVIAPVKEDIIRFKIIEKNDKILFEMPLYPAKNFFLPNNEKMLYFEKGKAKQIIDPPAKKRIIFLRKCDAAALVMLDKILLREPIDPYYKKRRENTLIIETPCTPTYSECFCDINKLPDAFDLRLVEFEDKYLFEIGTEKGKKLLKKAPVKTINKDVKEIPTKCPHDKCDFVIHDKSIKEENREVWKKEQEKCLSCGACTVVCPTCNCFEIRDELNLECDCGHRVRKWSSCQLPNFTQVAGGHIFRLDRGLRVKQRILHKYKYFKEQFGEIMCVGCGRCVAVCPTGINIFEIVKKLK